MIDEELSFFAVLRTSRKGTADSRIHSSSPYVANEQLDLEPAQAARAVMSGISRKDHTISRGVSVVIPFQLSDSGSIQFLVVSSRRHIGQCVFPKGGIELGESPEAAGEREAYEEAGVRGTIIAQLGPPITSPRYYPDTSMPKAIYYLHLLHISKLEEDWPEANQRSRKWLSREEAQTQCDWREEINIGFDRIPSDDQLKGRVSER